jgi:hypothetical protein
MHALPATLHDYNSISVATTQSVMRAAVPAVDCLPAARPVVEQEQAQVLVLAQALEPVPVR